MYCIQFVWLNIFTSILEFFRSTFDDRFALNIHLLLKLLHTYLSTIEGASIDNPRNLGIGHAVKFIILLWIYVLKSHPIYKTV